MGADGSETALVGLVFGSPSGQTAAVSLLVAVVMSLPRHVRPLAESPAVGSVPESENQSLPHTGTRIADTMCPVLSGSHPS